MRIRLVLGCLVLTLGIFCTPQASNAKSLIYQGGPTLGAHQVHIIWWGSARDFSRHHVSHVEGLFRNLSRFGSRGNVYSVLREYPGKDRSGKTIVSGSRIGWGGSVRFSLPDKYSPDCPKGKGKICLSDKDLRAIIKRAQQSQGWGIGLGHLYVVLLPDRATLCLGRACSWEQWAGTHGQEMFSGQSTPWVLLGDNGLDSSVDFLAVHEHLEAITDPLPYSGWITRDYQELADLCQDRPVRMQRIGSGQYLMPAMWSNRRQACVYS